MSFTTGYLIGVATVLLVEIASRIWSWLEDRGNR